MSWVSELNIPYLSIVIPAYNEEARLPGTLLQVYEFIAAQPYECEVIIIENGSQDRTLQIAQDFATQHPAFRVIHEEERGKGLAIQRGMLDAHGEFRFMCDADLSMPINQITRFIPPQVENFDLAIGSREIAGSIRYNEPVYRHIGGRLINTMIRTLVLPGLHDTQCGFKCFRADAAEQLFRHQTLPGWSFDIEILYLARKHNYQVIEIPIDWYFDPQTKLSAVKDAIQMFKDILRIHKNDRRGVYQS